MGGGQRQRGGGGGGGGGLYDDDSNIQTLDEPSFPSSSNGWVWLVSVYLGVQDRHLLFVVHRPLLS